MALRRLYQLRAVALSLVICMSLVSCSGSKISQENFEKIQTGMPLAQVTAILGEPTESSSVDVAVFSGTVSKWKAGDATITVQFVNGKVVAKQLSKGDK
ncbi:MAG: outer membrane protein assembly factor BamE [Deltaproteobacteria bacterium]|nr:outer membrane protein assembly factor BamE [Deltaproteobacteria bacterium]